MEELLFYSFRLITILGSSSALCTKRNSPVVDDGLELSKSTKKNTDENEDTTCMLFWHQYFCLRTSQNKNATKYMQIAAGIELPHQKITDINPIAHETLFLSKIQC